MTHPEELLATLETDPAGLRSDHLMNEFFRHASDALANQGRKDMEQTEWATGTLARKIFAKALPTPENWRLWYAGQLEGIAGLIRMILAERRMTLATTALLNGQKHPVTLLKLLVQGERNLTELAAKTGTDESQIGREINKLVQHGLVETAKEGRQRWARITNAGKIALAEMPEKREAEKPAIRRPVREVFPFAQESELLANPEALNRRMALLAHV